MRQHLSLSKHYQLEGVDMSAYIYCITNHITNQRYIGKTEHSVHKRFQRHKSNAASGSDMYLYRSMRKYGIENFSIDVLEETTKELANIRESYYIQESNPELNMTAGGDGGSTTHTRIWINDGSTNRYISKNDVIPEGFTLGRICKFSDPSFQSEMGRRAQKNIDFVDRGLAISKAKIGKTHAGVPHSQETKEKLSRIALNRKQIKCEHCNKLATAGMFSRWHGDKCKYANSDG